MISVPAQIYQCFVEIFTLTEIRLLHTELQTVMPTHTQDSCSPHSSTHTHTPHTHTGLLLFSQLHTHTHPTHTQDSCSPHSSTHTHTPHTHTGLLLSSQLHNASQLSSWCLHFISSNFNVLEANEQFLQLGEDNLSYVEEHRWPPLSYETAMNEYKTKYLDTEGEESGGCGIDQGVG